jgi:hypothetical protein
MKLVILTDNKKSYILARINLVRAACPKPLISVPENLANRPIVVEHNKQEYGSIQATGYCPKAVIVAGAAKRNALIAAGFVRHWAWVEDGSMDLKTDEAMSCNELMQKLQGQLYLNCSSILPWITEVYPFEHYSIYYKSGQKYKQQFTIDSDRNVKLSASPIALAEKTIAACISDRMPRVQTGVRYAYAPVVPNWAPSSRGGLYSELNTQIISNWGNIENAVANYLDVVRHGGYIQPAFAPVTIANNKLATTLAALGVDIFSFAKWSASAQEKTTKSVGGIELGPEQFACVGKKSDISTWEYPLHTLEHVQAAFKQVMSDKKIPALDKTKVLRKIQKAAVHNGNIRSGSKFVPGMRNQGAQIEELEVAKKAWKALGAS